MIPHQTFLRRASRRTRRHALYLDIERQALLAKAGLPNGFKVTMTCATPSDRRHRPDHQATWPRPSIELEISRRQKQT